MMSLIRHPLAGVIGAAVLLSGILGYMAHDRVMLLKNGREIVLPAVPVDPRDLFKGEYAQLGYPISRIDSPLMEKVRAGAGQRRQWPIFVTLEQASDGAWQPVAADIARPQKVAANQVVLRGRASLSSWRPIRYGLERYYVPEGKGRAVEDLARTSKLSVIVAVDGRGNAAIKGLMIDGRKVYDEPLL